MTAYDRIAADAVNELHLLGFETGRRIREISKQTNAAIHEVKARSIRARADLLNAVNVEKGGA